MNEIIQTPCIYALPVLMAITMHEAAHAYAARHFGDFTAAALGRITLNPLAHIDLIGTVILPLVAVVSGLPVIGWAKAVPVNGRHFKSPRLAWRWVAAAGPLANFAMMLFWALLLKVLVSTELTSGNATLFFEMAKAGIMVNVSLAVLNLLPILPLDGGRILSTLLPTHLAFSFSKTEQYGMWILYGLLLTGILSSIIQPIIQIILSVLLSMF